jgi:O-antigen ligase
MARMASAVAGPSRDTNPQIPHIPRKDSLPCHREVPARRLSSRGARPSAVIPRSFGRCRATRDPPSRPPFPSVRFLPFPSLSSWRASPFGVPSCMVGDRLAPTPAGSRVALAVLVGLVILSPWPFGSVHLRTTQAIALVLLATALGVFVWDGWRGELQLPPRGLLWPLLGLWALAVLQLIPLPPSLHAWLAPGSAAVWHPDVPAAAAVLGPGPHPVSLYPEATRRWLAFASGVVALALAAAPALRERRIQLRASIAVVAGALVVTAYGLVARLAFGDKLFGTWSVPTVAPFGPFVSKNHFAGYVELAALVAVGLATGLADEARRSEGGLSWIDSHRAKWVVLAWGAALVLVLAVPVSLSRGGVVSLTAGLASFVLLRGWARKGARLSATRLVAVLAGLGAAGLLFVAVLPTEARDRVLTLAGITSDQSGSYRLALWRDTLRLAASSPFVGSGFGAYEDALPRFKTAAGGFRVQHAENDHLELLAEGGLLAGVLGAIAVLALALLGLRAVRGTEHRLARSLFAAALAGIATVYAHSAFDFNLRIPSNALMASFLAAACVSALLPAAEPASSGSRALRSGAACVVLISLFIAFVVPWSDPRWDPAALGRVTAPARSDLRRLALESDAARLLRRRPAHAETWVQLGWLRLAASRKDGSALARWGLSLDPAHEELARVSAPVRDAAR